MKNKLFGLAVLIITLLFGITVISCEEDDGGSGGGSGGDSDWVNVTSLAQINGTWKGTYTPHTSQAEGEMTITINASKKTITKSQKETIKFSDSGINFNAVWDSLKTEFYPEGTQTHTDTDEDGNDITITYTVTIDESTHTITTISAVQKTVTNAEIAEILSSVQISKDGTKLKASGEDGDMIFYKQ